VRRPGDKASALVSPGFPAIPTSGHTLDGDRSTGRSAGLTIAPYANPDEVDVTTRVRSALNRLAQVSPDAPVRLRVTPVRDSNIVWIAGELGSSPGAAHEWGQGAIATLHILSGTAVARSRVTIAAGERTFLTSVKLPVGQDTTVDVQALFSPVSGGDTVTEVSLATAPQPLFYRSGPATANQRVMTADVHFARTDRAHLELPVTSGVKPAPGRILDRAGRLLKVPVTEAERTDAVTEQHWITADVALAPLAPGDYLIEVGLIEKNETSRVVTGIRVVQ
jgi:hypothetical protein